MSATTSTDSSNDDVGRSSSSGTYRLGHESSATGGEWTVMWKLKRNCSLTPRQLLAFYAVLCGLSLGVASVFWWYGATMVMPFAWMELLAVGAAMLAYARHATDGESIALRDDQLTVEHAWGGRVERVAFQPQWVRVEPQSDDDALVELWGQGHRIAVGRYVRPELRRQLADELRMALRHSGPGGSHAAR